MARSYRHKTYMPSFPFNVAMKLLVPTTTMVKGVAKKVYSDPKTSSQFFGNFKTYGGTENFSNEVYTVFDTAMIETWYNPNITPDCQIYICETGKTYQIINEPEDINLRHQFLRFKVERVGGKA